MGKKRVLQMDANARAHLLDTAFEEFIAEKEAKNLAPSTLRCYRQSYNYFTDFVEDALDEEEVTCDMVDQKIVFRWMNTMNSSGLKPASVNHFLRDVRTFLNWCMDSSREYVKPPFKVEMVRGQEETLKIYTAEEQKALIERPDRRNVMSGEWRTWAIVNWILATGNRASTVCNVKIEDLNFTRREINLRHTKNKKAQTIPMSTALETVLKEWIRKFRANAQPSDYLFPNVSNEKLTTNALRLSFERYAEARGVNHANIHGLRHTFAREYILNNGNTFALQKLLGHKTVAMTQRYVTLFSDDIKENFDSYSPLDTLKKGASRTNKLKRSRGDF